MYAHKRSEVWRQGMMGRDCIASGMSSSSGILGLSSASLSLTSPPCPTETLLLLKTVFKILP